MNNKLEKIKNKIKKSETLLEGIRKNVEDTKKSGLEHGFVICGNKKYEPTSFCVGKKCSIELTPVLKRAECVPFISFRSGTHHTHPEIKESYASFSDLASEMINIYHKYLPQDSIKCMTLWEMKQYVIHQK